MEDILHLWFLSAMLNAAIALALVGLGIVLSHGAGLRSGAAVLRLAQRLVSMFAAVMFLNCALHIVETRTPPPAWAMWTQVSLVLFAAVTVVRLLLYSPPIPECASWRRPVIRGISLVQDEPKKKIRGA